MGPKPNLLALSACSIARPKRRAVVALKAPPAIAGLNEHLVELAAEAWEDEIAGPCAALGLLAPASHHAPDEIDAHPLVREHFGERLKTERPEAWRAGHGRLYEHLKDSAKQLPDTLAEMAPLFQAVHHGCQAGRFQEASGRGLLGAHLRGTKEYYLIQQAWRVSVLTWRRFRASSMRLGARPVETLTRERSGVGSSTQAGFDLRALGRLREAVAPMRAALERGGAQTIGTNAAIARSISPSCI